MRLTASAATLVTVMLTLAVLSPTHGLFTRREFRLLRKQLRVELVSKEFLLPRLVQMSFHDCLGGCDGCLDPDVPNNSNLGPAIEFSKQFRAKYAPELSQADVTTFISSQIVEITAKNANGRIKMPLYIGRRDCDSSNGFPARVFAQGQATTSLDFLQINFALTRKEAVALMGGHNLGRTNADVSGFDGPWINAKNNLGSGYYQNIIAPGWVVQDKHTAFLDSSQWSKNLNQPNMTMMLHADMAIFVKFVTTSINDRPNCGFDHCPLSDTADIVRRFAKNQKIFHKTFAKAFLKMVTTGRDKLKKVA